MVHTLPPWTTKYRMTKIFGQIDTGELAARLSSPVTFDRRGNVVWLDDFEGISVNWGNGGAGSGNSQVIHSDRSWTKTNSMKLVTGASANNTSYIRKHMYFPSSTKIGIEAYFCPTASNQEISLIIYGYDGDDEYTAAVTWDPTAKKLYYMNSGGDPVELGSGFEVDSLYEYWLPIKLVIDFDTKKYVRVLSANAEWDLSAQSLKTTGSEIHPGLRLWILIKTTVNAAKTCYVDNVIFTQNEP